MSVSFQFVGLPAAQFAPLFRQSDAELDMIGARRIVVDEKPGYPCRVSLADAEIGETVLALPFTHHDVAGPYRSSGPIFVRAGAASANPPPGEIPAMFHHRLLSVRGYDANAQMIAADVCPGTVLREAIERIFGDDRVRYLHVHNARPGCFNCRVSR